MFAKTERLFLNRIRAVIQISTFFSLCLRVDKGFCDQLSALSLSNSDPFYRWVLTTSGKRWTVPENSGELRFFRKKGHMSTPSRKSRTLERRERESTANSQILLPF